MPRLILRLRSGPLELVDTSELTAEEHLCQWGGLEVPAGQRPGGGVREGKMF